MDRVLTPLDVFDRRINVTRDSLNQFVKLINRRLDVLKQEVKVLKTRFRRSQAKPTEPDSVIAKSEDDERPFLEIVPIEECVKYLNESNRNQASTSAGNKRRASAQIRNCSTSHKRSRRMNPQPNSSNNKYPCKWDGCGKSFLIDGHLAMHERIHLRIKPFSCIWPDCRYSSNERSKVIRHVRIVHFKLPQSVKTQMEQNIEDDRDPNEYVRVDEELAKHRL